MKSKLIRNDNHKIQLVCTQSNPSNFKKKVFNFKPFRRFFKPLILKELIVNFTLFSMLSITGNENLFLTEFNIIFQYNKHAKV